MVDARYETGNGITLCSRCHREAHAGFNGRPDLNQPMDAEGGEKIELMMDLYGTLMSDAAERGILRDDYYFLSDNVLGRFKMFQGYDPYTPFPGTRLEQAYSIWRQTPKGMRDAILQANGIEPFDGPLPPGEAYIVFAD